MVKYRILKRAPRYSLRRISGYLSSYTTKELAGYGEYHVARYSPKLRKYVTLVILTNKESAEATLKYFKELKDVQFND